MIFPIAMKTFTLSATLISIILFVAAICSGFTNSVKNQRLLVEPASADSFSLSSGKQVFIQKCAPCHGNQGQGGGAPNLCDAYWLHGHHYHNISHVIHHGVTDKGMPSWKHQLTKQQMRDVGHYVYISLKGSNPPDAKAPQGKYHK